VPAGSHSAAKRDLSNLLELAREAARLGMNARKTIESEHVAGICGRNAYPISAGLFRVESKRGAGVLKMTSATDTIIQSAPFATHWSLVRVRLGQAS